MLKLKRIFKPDEIKAWKDKQNTENLKVVAKLKAAGLPSDVDNSTVKAFVDMVADQVPVPNPTHMEVIKAKDKVHLSTGFVDRGIRGGYLGIGAGRITINTGPGKPPLVYRIVTSPGRYCSHCQQQQPDFAQAKRHVASVHAGVKSPDKNNPAGYRMDNFYSCVKEG